MTKVDFFTRPPVERWTRLITLLRAARANQRTMCDRQAAVYTRDAAAVDYVLNSEAVMAELDALDAQGALHDVPAVLDLTYGRA